MMDQDLKHGGTDITFIHTFWSVPLCENYFNNFEISLKTNLLDYAYSAALVLEWGYKIKLFADKRGAELLDFIPYDEVIIINDFQTNDPRFAANIKFEALKQCSLNEILIDGDLFFIKPTAIDYVLSKKEDLVCSFIEPQHFWKNNVVGTILKNLKKSFKSEFKYTLKDNPFMCNTSLIKLNNQELKDKWIEQYFRLLPEISKVNEKQWLDIILEQIHLTQLVKDHYSVGIIADEFPLSECNEQMLKLGFTHLGSCKSDPNIINWVSKMCIEHGFDILSKIKRKVYKELS